MDLTKIIGGLRAELQCMEAAILAMEALERAQKSSGTEAASIESDSEDPDAVAVRRKRGRPRKVSLPETAVPAVQSQPDPMSQDLESTMT